MSQEEGHSMNKSIPILTSTTKLFMDPIRDHTHPYSWLKKKLKVSEDLSKIRESETWILSMLHRAKL